MLSDAKHSKHNFNYTGMAQRLARVAHNHEVTRSKRVAGIYHFGIFKEIATL
jgi:hypothetical protein